MSFEALHTTVSVLRGIPLNERKKYVTAWLNEHALYPGTTEVRVTPWHVETVGEVPKVEMTIAPLEMALIDDEVEQIVGGGDAGEEN